MAKLGSGSIRNEFSDAAVIQSIEGIVILIAVFRPAKRTKAAEGYIHSAPPSYRRLPELPSPVSAPLAESVTGLEFAAEDFGLVFVDAGVAVGPTEVEVRAERKGDRFSVDLGLNGDSLG